MTRNEIAELVETIVRKYEHYADAGESHASKSVSTQWFSSPSNK